MKQGHTIKVLDHGFVRYIDHMGSDQSIIAAARVSYNSQSKGDEADKKLLGYLYKNRHTSPFEMGKVHLNIKMPIFVMRQYIRHRMQNVNEVSARYSELPNEFYIPTKWRAQDVKNKQGSNPVECWDKRDSSGYSINGWNTHLLKYQCEEAYRTYKILLERGVAREMARMVLPVNIYTEIQAVWDIKNLLHFIALREDSHAQAEIQVYGKAIKEIVSKLFPWTMEAFGKYKFKLVETL